ncbi:MAG TPA: hypothetical protein PK648_01975 [Verrucomicrobiales bacterium]|nr:hypothetical protein [Verrucomicrobiales bacterium]
MKTYFQRGRLLAPGFFLVASVVIDAGEPSTRLFLSPDSPALSEVSVPLLHEEVPEHRLSGGGLSLLPETGPYEWTKVGPTRDIFRLKLRVEADQFAYAVLTVWNWQNFPVQQIRIEAGKEELLEIEISALGTYLLTLDGFQGDRFTKRLIRNIAVTRDVNHARKSWKKEEFFVGICAFPGRYHWKPGGIPTLPTGLSEEKARDREAALIARLGLQVVRTDESLEMGRKQSGGNETYFFHFDRMDAALRSYTSRGFQLVLQTMNAADWAVLPKYADKGNFRWQYPHQETPQRAYLAALVERYRDVTRFVQISNEPDQIGYWAGTNDEFVTQFVFSQDEVRKVAPELPLTYGGYSVVDEVKSQYFLQKLHSLVDFPTYNAHGNLEDYKRSFATMKRLQKLAGDPSDRWINTETGYSAWRLEQERRQAQIDAQKVLYSWANGHAGVLLFCSRMTRGPGRDGTPDFGFVDYQFSPRFVYGAIAALTSTLTGASFERGFVESAAEHLYVFRRGNDLILAGFTLGEEGSLTISTDAKEVVPMDEMGNERSPQTGGRVTLDLIAYPRYWVLRDATVVEE